MDQAERDALFNSTHSVHRFNIGETHLFVYAYNHERSGQVIGPNQLSHVRIFHAASLPGFIPVQIIILQPSGREVASETSGQSDQ